MPKILAIDDKQDNLITLSAIFKTFLPECDLIIAQSGSEGIEKAKTVLPDTILLDIKMPKMDGYEVCRSLKEDEKTKNIPVILISAIRTDSKDLVKGLEAGADAYLAKPIDECVLIAQVNTALRLKDAENNLQNQKKILATMVRKRTIELERSNRKLKNEIKEHHRVEKEKKALESQLRQSQKMEAIGILAGGIAHDFNNILYVISGYTEITLDEVPEGSSAHSNLKEVMKGVARATEMVQHILLFSRKSNVQKQSVKLYSVINDVVKFLRGTIPSTIDIDLNIDTDCGYIFADLTQINQLIMNLATNSYHAMQKKGGILGIALMEKKISSDNLDFKSNLSPGTYLKLTISDTGCGMDKEVLGKIFDPYFTTKEVGKGTGMGLSMAHGIVKDHGGDIKVYSEPGKGTKFDIYFPLGENESVKQKALPAGADLTGTERILFVDDEEALILMEKYMLENLGYCVTSQINSMEALEIFKRNPDEFDLVITDLTMPHMAGIELASKIIKIKPDIPVIICTGFSDINDEIEAKAAGICEFIMKPIVKKQMASIIRKVLDKKKR